VPTRGCPPADGRGGPFGNRAAPGALAQRVLRGPSAALAARVVAPAAQPAAAEKSGSSRSARCRRLRTVLRWVYRARAARAALNCSPMYTHSVSRSSRSASASVPSVRATNSRARCSSWRASATSWTSANRATRGPGSRARVSAARTGPPPCHRRTRPPHHPRSISRAKRMSAAAPGRDFQHRARRDGYLAVVAADVKPAAPPAGGDRPLAHSITFVAQLARKGLHRSYLGNSTVSSLPRVVHRSARPSPWMHATGAKSGQSHRSPLASRGKLLGRLRAPIRSCPLLRFQDSMP
jgi:hypothetical protein